MHTMVALSSNSHTQSPLTLLGHHFKAACRATLRSECVCAIQVFPLSVQLHLKDAGVSVSFFYLPAVGIVTAEASTKAGNAMLASLFQRDTGKDAPSEANHYIGQGTFDLDPQATARPYRWQIMAHRCIRVVLFSSYVSQFSSCDWTSNTQLPR